MRRHGPVLSTALGFALCIIGGAAAIGAGIALLGDTDTTFYRELLVPTANSLLELVGANPIPVRDSGGGSREWLYVVMIAGLVTGAAGFAMLVIGLGWGSKRVAMRGGRAMRRWATEPGARRPPLEPPTPPPPLPPVRVKNLADGKTRELESP